MTPQTNPAELVIFGNPRQRKSGFTEAEKKELRRLHFRPSDFKTSAEEQAARETLKKIDEIRRRNPSVPEQHQIKIARATLRMSDIGARIMGGMTKDEARAVLQKHGIRASNPRRRSRRNPKPEELTQAVELYETFQGKRAENIIEAQRSAAMRTDYAALGPLLAIGLYTPDLKIPSPDHWEDYPHLKFGKDVMLASNAGASQLYAIGGDQDVSKVAAQIPDVDTSKDLLDLGPIAFVVYFARKSADNFQPTEYMHQFDTPRPSLGFDQVKREIFFAGGRYTIEERGIDH
jgi:hypothetical protein